MGERTIRQAKDQVSLALESLSSNVSGDDEKAGANKFLESFQKSVSFHSGPSTVYNTAI
jgi:hypothetical protein